MSSLPVPGCDALPTAAAAKEKSQFNACEADKKVDAEIKKEILFKELRPGEFKVYKMI